MARELFNVADHEEMVINQIQFDLDHHPSNSPFWDSRQGQDTLAGAEQYNLKSQTSETFRRQWLRDQMEAAEKELRR